MKVRQYTMTARADAARETGERIQAAAFALFSTRYYDDVTLDAIASDADVTVAAVYPNGTMLVQGQKSVTLNRGDEYIRIKGIVRTADITADNRIASTRVADARIAAGTARVLLDPYRRHPWRQLRPLPEIGFDH